MTPRGWDLAAASAEIQVPEKAWLGAVASAEQ
jgi:hypothetical protein